MMLKLHSFYVFSSFCYGFDLYAYCCDAQTNFATRLKTVFIMEKYNLENSSLPIQNKGFVAIVTFVFYLGPS